MTSTVHEVVQASGASLRQVHHWISMGWLKTQRTGWVHVLPDGEADVARLMVWLIDAGFSASRAAGVARRIGSDGYAEIPLQHGFTLIYAPGSSLFTIPVSDRMEKTT